MTHQVMWELAFTLGDMTINPIKILHMVINNAIK